MIATFNDEGLTLKVAMATPGSSTARNRRGNPLLYGYLKGAHKKRRVGVGKGSNCLRSLKAITYILDSVLQMECVLGITSTTRYTQA